VSQNTFLIFHSYENIDSAPTGILAKCCYICSLYGYCNGWLWR